MKNFTKKYSTQIIVVFIVFLFLELAFFFSLKFVPFEKANLLVSDLYFEYVPFFNYMRDAILNGRSIFTSFSFSLGQSIVGILSYYCLSPLNVLLLFSNANNITYFIKVLIILKIVLCGLNMSIYLNNKTDKLHNIMFSVIFAFITYNLKYAFNIMWLDVVYMLPLVILGLEKMIDGKSNKLYIISLTIMIFSNFYIAYNACIFIFIYFLFYSIIKQKLTWKLFWKFAYSSVIAAILNAFMLIPTMYNMLNGKAINAVNSYSKLVLYNPLNAIYNFSPGKTAGYVLNDLPYFYSSTLILILFINYLFNKEVPINEKILASLIVIFIIFSTLIAPLDLFFHCFKVPNSLYYRYIYILPFFLISIVSRYEVKINWFSLIPIVLIIGWALAVEFSPKMIIFSTLLILYSIFIEADFKFLLIILVIFELFYNSLISLKFYSGYGEYEEVKPYDALLEEYYPKENEFYRVELNEPIVKNESFLFGYYGITSFSPTISNSTKIFLKNYLLMAEQNSLNYVYQDRFILDPYFLGIKYEIIDGKVKENNHYLPLVIKTDNFDYFEPTKLLIENSNNLYKMINGEYLFKEIDFEISCVKDNKVVDENCNIKYSKKDGYDYYLEIYISSNNVFTEGFLEHNDIIEVDENIVLAYHNIHVDSIKLYEYDKNSIKDQQNDPIVFKDDYMQFNVDKGLYVTTIPYDDSWHIRVNGKEIKKIKVLDSLIGFETDGGIVEIEFIPKGLIAGMIISGITLSTIIVYLVRKRNRCGNEKNIEKI